jgi:hypothetical protein
MTEVSKGNNCFQCQIAETETPLLTLTFNNKPLWICPQCLPALIHHPERVADKLSSIDQSNAGTKKNDD